MLSQWERKEADKKPSCSCGRTFKSLLKKPVGLHQQVANAAKVDRGRVARGNYYVNEPPCLDQRQSGTGKHSDTK